jgi:methylated-DNA-protein-cysteine methyltransferase related protein
MQALVLEVRDVKGPDAPGTAGVRLLQERSAMHGWQALPRQVKAAKEADAVKADPDQPAGEAAPTATQRVLALVASVPRGRVVTYRDVAEYLGLGSPRQVGRALASVHAGVPWHRVVHSDGTMAEEVRDKQRQLLLEEGVHIVGQRVDLRAHRWSGRDI